MQLIFEGIRGSSFTGDIAIDNVVLQDCGGVGGGGGCGKLKQIQKLNLDLKPQA